MHKLCVLREGKNILLPNQPKTFLVILQIVGPRLMENRNAFKLRSVLILYNILQVLANSWIVYEASVSGWMSGYSYRCQAIDRSESPNAMRVKLNVANELSPPLACFRWQGLLIITF